MKKIKIKISAEIELLIPELIAAFRRFQKLAGPDHELQTREFRTTCDNVQKIETAFETAGFHEEFYSREIIAAYLLYHFPLHYGQGLSLLGELPFVPKRVLEVASGLAPFSLAALKYGAQEVFAIDQNEVMLKLGAELIGRAGYPITMRKWSHGKDLFPVSGTFDLIILPYCLNELFPDDLKNSEERKLQFIHECLARLNPTGFLLLVDRTDQKSNTQILKIREHFVAKGIAVQAPCLCKSFCPALDSKSPCYAQREYEKPYFIKEIQRGASIFLNSLKMSYLILKSPHAKWPQVPNEASLFRVVSPPIEHYVDKRYYLCGVNGKGKLELSLAEKSYELQRGSLIQLEGRSKYKMVAAPGKPLPEIDEITGV